MLTLLACRNEATVRVAPPPLSPTSRAGLEATSLPNATDTAVIERVATPAPTRPAANRGPSSSVAAPVAPSTRPQVGGLLSPEGTRWYEPSSSNPLAYLLHHELTRSLLDPLSAGPEIALRWSMDSVEATFTLAPAAEWSDGTRLDASGVVAVLRRAVEAGSLSGIESVEVIDERTVELLLSGPDCSPLMQAATWPLTDGSEWPPAQNSGNVSITAQDEELWIIEPERFTYRVFPDELALREAWARGEINSILGANRLTMGSLPGPVEPSHAAGPLLATLLFKMNDPVVGDAGLREALTLATDRTALFKTAYGFAPSALLAALLPPDHWAAPAGPLPHDPERAAELLAQAGWNDGNGDGLRENGAGEELRLVLSTPLSPDQRWERLAHALAEQWAAIGVRLEPLYVESYALEERLHTGRWQVTLLAYDVVADPDQRALWSVPAPDDLRGRDLNIMGYNNATVSDLLTQGAQVPGCRPAERASFYHEAWEQLLRDRPLWPLFPLPLDEVHRPIVEWDR
ncbi:MAG: ABC transporter substrate-binding protein [Ardenticatenaceae bacterium]